MSVREECTDLLHREAEYLDDRRFTDWLTCLHEDLVYEMPIRVTRLSDAGKSDFSTSGYHMRDTYHSMAMRVSRLATEHAYAEDPPSRTQRLITNIRVRESTADEAAVRSSFLCYRAQGDGVEHDLLVGERCDVLRATPDGWKVAKRVVKLAHTTLLTVNLGVFL